MIPASMLGDVTFKLYSSWQGKVIHQNKISRNYTLNGLDIIIYKLIFAPPEVDFFIVSLFWEIDPSQ